MTDLDKLIKVQKEQYKKENPYYENIFYGYPENTVTPECLRGIDLQNYSSISKTQKKIINKHCALFGRKLMKNEDLIKKAFLKKLEDLYIRNELEGKDIMNLMNSIKEPKLKNFFFYIIEEFLLSKQIKQ